MKVCENLSRPDENKKISQKVCEKIKDRPDENKKTSQQVCEKSKVTPTKTRKQAKKSVGKKT